MVRVRNTAATTTHQFSDVECNRMDSAVDRHQMALQSPLFLPVRPTSSRPTKRRHNAYVPESIVDVVWELRDLESTRASTYKWKIRSGSTDAQRQTTAVHLVHIVSVEIFDSITYVI